LHSSSLFTTHPPLRSTTAPVLISHVSLPRSRMTLQLIARARRSYRLAGRLIVSITIAASSGPQNLNTRGAAPCPSRLTSSDLPATCEIRTSSVPVTGWQAAGVQASHASIQAHRGGLRCNAVERDLQPDEPRKLVSCAMVQWGRLWMGKTQAGSSWLRVRFRGCMKEHTHIEHSPLQE